MGKPNLNSNLLSILTVYYNKMFHYLHWPTMIIVLIKYYIKWHVYSFLIIVLCFTEFYCFVNYMSNNKNEIKM